MNKIIQLSKKDKVILYTNASAKLGLSSFIIEKDFWVVYIIDFLFNKSKYKDFFVFKGGTCLSKCYSIIKRFSEDIDIVLLWSIIGINSNDALIKRNSHQSEKFNKKIAALEEEFILKKLIPELNAYLTKGFNIYLVKETKSPYIAIEYPTVFTNSPIEQIIRLEIGSLSNNEPTNIVTIKPYVSNIIETTKTNVKAATLEHIFWEKVLTVHKENKRNKPNLERKSRHLYDLYCLSKNGIAIKAIKDKNLMKKILNINIFFYNNKAAGFEQLLSNGNFCLLPDKEHKKAFIKDFEETTRNLLFEDVDTNDVVKEMKSLQEKLNKK